MNKVILLGRLTKEPEMRYTQNGKGVATFTLAVDRASKEKEADFLRCVAWGKTAEAVSNWLVKGRQILVEGRLESRSYEAKDGQKRYVTEVIVGHVEFCGSAGGGSASSKKRPAGRQEEPVLGGNAPDLQDEEIPF